MGTLSDRAIAGDGTREQDWLRWFTSSPVPMEGLDHWLVNGQRLVVVAPHPDDEVLCCGGLIAQHTARGGQTLVIAVSDGEASHADTSGWKASQLAETRRWERAEGLARLGARAAKVIRLGLPDGRVGEHAHELTCMIARLISPTDVVVSTWRHDAHPDHEATGKAAVRACAASGCRLLEAPVWMWHWASPGDLRVPWRRLTAVPLARHVVQQKRFALSAHASQLRARDVSTGPVLGPEILARSAWPAEYFFA